MVDISQIFFSSSRLTIDKRSLDSHTLPPLRENDIIEAKVLKMLSGRSAQLMILGQSVTVKTHVLLKEGEIINLRVESSGDKQILKLVEKQDPAQQVNKVLADNLDRSGPYKNLLKLFDMINVPEKISPQGFLKGESIKSGGEEISKTLDKYLNVILTQSNADERSRILSFINTKTIPFKDKLSALITSTEGKTVLTKLAEENVPLKDVLEKILQAFSKDNTSSVKVGIDPPQIGNRLFSKEMKTGALPKDINGKNPDQFNLPDKQIVDEFIQSKTTRWTHKLISVLAGNIEVIARHDHLLRDVEKVIALLLGKFDSLDDGKDTSKKSLLSGLRGNRIRQDAAKNQMLDQVKLIRELVKSMSLKSDSPDTDLAKNFVRKSGMAWEKKLSFMIQAEKTVTRQKVNDMALKDLKGLALSTLSSLDESDKNTGTVLRNFVDTLEQLQVINRYSSEESGKYLLPFPVMVNESFKFGQLLIDLGKENNKDKPLKDRVVKVAFILELSNLGDLRADFSIFRKSVMGVFGVGKREFRTIVKREIPGLEKRLKTLGYKVSGIDCQVIDPVVLSNTTLTNQVIKKESDGILNLVI
ncbi:MAG: hypothetical protein KJ737_23610 [Proteobacteria bacterium]|nr:hypothetical protein [Pseudomonadota bacterium]